MTSKDIMLTIQKLNRKDWPKLLMEINDPPKCLFAVGNIDLLKSHYLISVIGSRKHTDYVHRVLRVIFPKLASYPIAIVSGLAFGSDTLAHEYALKFNMPTIAIPGSGLDTTVLYPRTNLNLANTIIKEDGLLLSEYEPMQKAARWTFPKRNRLIAGISHLTIVIEAAQKSGSLITARLAMEYNRSVLAVPGPIDSQASFGTNNLIHDGARPLLSSTDILEELNISVSDAPMPQKLFLSTEEQRIIELLEFTQSRDDLIRQSPFPITTTQITLTKMEVRGLITQKLGKIYTTIN